MGFNFKTVELRGIVAGGDHDAADSALLLDGEGDGRSRSGIGTKADFESVGGEDFGGAAAEGIGEEAAIVADYGFWLGAGDRVGFPIIGSGLGNAFDVGKSEILGDDCAPAVCSELDRHLSRASVMRGFSSPGLL